VRVFDFEKFEIFLSIDVFFAIHKVQLYIFYSFSSTASPPVSLQSRNRRYKLTPAFNGNAYWENNVLNSVLNTE